MRSVSLCLLVPLDRLANVACALSPSGRSPATQPLRPMLRNALTRRGSVTEAERKRFKQAEDKMAAVMRKRLDQLEEANAPVYPITPWQDRSRHLHLHRPLARARRSDQMPDNSQAPKP